MYVVQGGQFASRGRECGPRSIDLSRNSVCGPQRERMPELVSDGLFI